MATAAATVEPVNFLEKTESEKRAETVGDLMAPAVGVFSPTTTVGEAIEALREATRTAFITYLYIVDPNQHLMGLVVMREMLLATGKRIIVEAAPTDRIWGIGLAEDDRRALDRSEWRGQNLLGFALTRVRDEIAAEG